MKRRRFTEVPFSFPKEKGPWVQKERVFIEE